MMIQPHLLAADGVTYGNMQNLSAITQIVLVWYNGC
jgi:hypothetical protein